MHSYKIGLLLFTTFFKVALFVVGGGLAIIPAIEDIFVRKHKLLNDQDMVDMVTMTQTVPGLIAVNAALFTGHRLMGGIGSLIAVMGLIIPSIIILSLVALFFNLLSVDNPVIQSAFSCVRAAVAGIFISTAVYLGKNIIKNKFDIAIVVVFIMALFFVKPVYLILFALPVGWVYMFLSDRQARSENGEKQ